ncbi:hypothetical protein CJU89_5609 [Yarrowia sp. B02]|nr:hypothetical protein CJU89_5609 [Yarrowia sp. B02]
MLPTEVLTQVSSYLDKKDVVSLAETSSENFETLNAVRKVHLKSPYSRLELSQWPSWEAYADNFETEIEPELFKRVELPKHVNEVLPEDFKALQGDLARQWNSEWNSCDRGICGTREDDKEAKVLDLSAEGDSDTCKPTVAPENTRRRLFTDHHEVGYKFSPQTEALLEWNMESGCVTLYTIDSDGKRDSHEVTEKKGTEMYHLQLISDIALVFVLTLTGQTTFYLVPGGKLTPLDFGGCQVPQEGLMLYNGHFFKAVIDEKVDLQVAPVARLMGKATTITPAAAYEICQDVRLPRYGLAYTNMDKNLAHVVDLEKKQISQFFGMDKDVCLVGVSNGELAVWKYTREYLEKKCDEQEKPEMKELVEQLFQNNINWEEFHKELVDAWVDED